MFGGERWMNYRFTLDTFDWPSIQCGYPPEPGANCPGTFIEAFDFRPVANDPNHPLVDPDLKAARSQEFTLGLDRELNRTMSLGVRYVHKWVDYAVEAVCVPLPNGEDCGVNNPGFGSGEFPLGRSLPAQPAAERLYDGFEVRLRKRFADSWSADASYLLSHLRGNWSGLASSDEAVGGELQGGLQLNSGRAFNLLYYSFDANGQPSNGLLSTDRPHQFKGQVTYDTPWRMTIGANYLLESGTPQSTVADEKGMSFFPYGRGDLGRSPVFSRTDLRVQQELRIGRTRLAAGVDFINLFDQDGVTKIFTRPYRDGFNLDDPVFFAGFDPEAVVAATPGFLRDARYGMANAFQSRREIRVQVRFTF
jgi:hypothetical protein